MDVRTYARIKIVIWNQLLANPDIKLYFRFACKMKFLLLFILKGIFNVLKKVLRLASAAMECIDSDK